MPIYEYRCEQGHVFDVMQRFTDDPVTSCQTCDAPVERVFHPVAVHFKGSGFYSTDYGKRKRARSEEGGESSSEKKSDSADKKSEGSDKKSESKDKTSETRTRSDKAAA